MMEVEKECITTQIKSCIACLAVALAKICLLVKFNTRPQVLIAWYFLFTFDRTLPCYSCTSVFCSFLHKKREKKVCGNLEMMQQCSSLNHILISLIHQFRATCYKALRLNFFEMKPQLYDN